MLMNPIWILLFLLFVALTGRDAEAGGLSYTLGERGLSRLIYNGQVLVDGDSMTIEAAVFQRPDGTTYTLNGWESVQWLPRTGNTVTAQEPWGRISCTYTQVGDGVVIDVSIHNATTNLMTGAQIRFQNPTVPLLKPAKFWRFDVDMCWANDHPDQGTDVWRSGQCIPLIQCDYATGCLALAQSEFPGTPEKDVGLTLHAPEKYPLLCYLNIGGIAPGQTKTRQFTLRFAPAGTDPYAPDNYLHDLFEKYHAAHPMLVQWDDRRPILQETWTANGIPVTPQNPRCYYTQQDLRTEAGKVNFRAELMGRADSYIANLKKANAQGIVFWSIEGIEGVSVLYEGDPTRIALAPEMEYKDASGVATVDAFLKRFTDAGFRVGHCLRPQELRGTPLVHHDVAEPAKVLIDKIRYCQKRWGSTLFYMDSTVKPNGQGGWDALAGSVYRQVHEACPDVLLMPENQCADVYAYAAPYDESNHYVYQTPRKVRAIWPGAFTVIRCRSEPTNAMPQFVEGVRQGNILLFAPGDWDAEFVASIYRQAGVPPSGCLTAQVRAKLLSSLSHILINVEASDADGTITKVEFYASTVEAGRVKLGESTAAPYRFSWKEVPPGRYVLSARIVDDAGMDRWPASVVVLVGGK